MMVAPSFHKRIKLVVYLIWSFCNWLKIVGIFRGINTMQIQSQVLHASKAFVAKLYLGQ
jgi:hypothetical protein